MLSTVSGLSDTIAFCRDFDNGWYASEYIPKVAEHRVFIVGGRVVAVANKTPDDPDAIAWNMAQGAKMSNVKWGDWNLEACRIAIQAFNLTGLDFVGADIMIDAEGRPYILEFNSAPTMMMKSDGDPSYRHMCMAKGLKYLMEGEVVPDVPEVVTSWRDVIHPAIYE